MKKIMKAVVALMLMTAVFYSAECLNAQNHKGHDYVDLGLPSGTLWATCNVGATTPEGYGDYFAWGETQPKTVYHCDNYKYASGSSDKKLNNLTKYCCKSDMGNNGFTDNLKVLHPDDDAATANWGSGWRMPTKSEWQELYQNTTHTWEVQNGVCGRLFTASNGNSLFLPAAGHMVDRLYWEGECGYYWSSSLSADYSNSAWYLSVNWDIRQLRVRKFNRSCGLSVRPVRAN